MSVFEFDVLVGIVSFYGDNNVRLEAEVRGNVEGFDGKVIDVVFRHLRLYYNEGNDNGSKKEHYGYEQATATTAIPLKAAAAASATASPRMAVTRSVMAIGPRRWVGAWWRVVRPWVHGGGSVNNDTNNDRGVQLTTYEKKKKEI